LRHEEPEHTADQADPARYQRRNLALRPPLDEVLRVEREYEEAEPPELIPEHLEADETDGRRGAGCHLPETCRDRVDHPPGLIDDRRHVGAGLDVPKAGRHQRPDREDDGTPEDDQPRRKEATGRERERDPHDLEERAAGLRQGVALEQVAAREHVGDRGRLHREGHADHRLGGEQPEDERGGGAGVPLGGALAQREQERERHRRHDPGRDHVRPPHHPAAVEPVDHDPDER